MVGHTIAVHNTIRCMSPRTWSATSWASSRRRGFCQGPRRRPRRERRSGSRAAARRRRRRCRLRRRVEVDGGQGHGDASIHEGLGAEYLVADLVRGRSSTRRSRSSATPTRSPRRPCSRRSSRHGREAAHLDVDDLVVGRSRWTRRRSIGADGAGLSRVLRQARDDRDLGRGIEGKNGPEKSSVRSGSVPIAPGTRAGSATKEYANLLHELKLRTQGPVVTRQRVRDRHRAVRQPPQGQHPDLAAG